MADETRRWLDGDLPDELRDVLASASSDSADAQSIQRLRAGLESSLGPAAWNTRTPHAPSPNETVDAGAQGTGGVALGGKLATTPVIALGVSTMIALGFGGYMLRGGGEAIRPVQPSAAPVVAPARVGEPATVAAPAPVAAPTRDPVAAEPGRSAGTSRARSAAMRDEPSLSEELKGLDRIRQTMAQPTRALAAVERQARRFPDGALVPERELLQLEALYKAGRIEKAEQLGKRMTSEGAHPYRAQALRLMAEARAPRTE